MKLETEKRGSSWEWRLDVTIARRRYRETFTTKKKAEDFVAELKVQTQRRRHRLPIEFVLIPLSKLVEAFVATLGDSKNDIRCVRILVFADSSQGRWFRTWRPRISGTMSRAFVVNPRS